MNWRYQLAIVAVCGVAVWLAVHYHGKYTEEQERANTSAVITGNVLRTISILNQITEANQHAKQQIAQESQRVADDIKIVVAVDDCANRPVPAGAAERLREYSNSLRAGSTRPAAHQPDR